MPKKNGRSFVQYSHLVYEVLERTVTVLVLETGNYDTFYCIVCYTWYLMLSVTLGTHTVMYEPCSTQDYKQVRMCERWKFKRVLPKLIKSITFDNTTAEGIFFFFYLPKPRQLHFPQLTLATIYNTASETNYLDRVLKVKNVLQCSFNLYK